MWSLASRPNEMLMIRFKVLESTNNQTTINTIQIKKSKKSLLFQMIFTIKLLNSKILKRNKESIYQKTVTTPTGKKIVGHFIFNLTKYRFEKKFSRKFKRMFPNLKLRPKDIRISSLSNEMKEFEIHREASLGQHTITTTKRHYTRTGVNL